MVQAVEELKKPTVVLKLVELLLAVICIGVCAGEWLSTSPAKHEVIHGTFIGFFINGIVVVNAHFMETPLHNRLLLVISAVASLMYLVSAALLLETYVDTNHWNDNLIAGGILALINCVVYIVDAVFTYKLSF